MSLSTHPGRSVCASLAHARITRPIRLSIPCYTASHAAQYRRRKCRTVVFVRALWQIEIFTWSASGQIITESLSACFPVVVLYVLDTARTTSPVTFMSNMLYACSILYKTQVFPRMCSLACACTASCHVAIRSDVIRCHAMRCARSETRSS